MIDADLNARSGLARVEDLYMVDAALAGFEQGEVITIHSLPDIADWEAYEAARQKLMPNLSRQLPAARYLKGNNGQSGRTA